MQRKFHDRILFRESKLEILGRYWDIKLSNLHTKAKKAGNTAVLRLCENVYKVDIAVKAHVLAQYLLKTQVFTWIFLYKQRKLTCPTCDKVEIDLQIAKLLQWV